MAKPKDNLSSDISKLPRLGYAEQPWETKGEVVNPYGTERMSQPSDGDLADAAFERLGQKPESYSHTPPAVTPKPMTDGEAADAAWKHLGN
jgi:hypothetical protein